MELTELFAKGVSWAMNNPIGRSVFAKAYKKETGKDVCMSCPADIYEKYFELKKTTQNNNG